MIDTFRLKESGTKLKPEEEMDSLQVHQKPKMGFLKPTSQFGLQSNYSEAGD